jgi:hypothetical protein
MGFGLAAQGPLGKLAQSAFDTRTRSLGQSAARGLAVCEMSH